MHFYFQDGSAALRQSRKEKALLLLTLYARQAVDLEKTENGSIIHTEFYSKGGSCINIRYLRYLYSVKRWGKFKFMHRSP